MSQQDDEMRCEIVLDHIESFIDDELPAEFATRLRRHIECCPSCSEELENARQTIAALRRLPELDPPDRLIEEVRREVATGHRNRSVFGGSRNRLLAAAAAVLISVVGGLSLLQRHQSPDAEALQAAAEIEYAVACVGEITRRANVNATTRVMNGTAVSTALDGVTRTLEFSSNLLPTTVPSTNSPTSEGSS